MDPHGLPNPSAVAADERTALRQWLDFHREVLLWKCRGLSAAQLSTRPVATSKLSLHGLVRHMAAVERGWFRRFVGGEDVPNLYWSHDDPDGDFDGVDGADWDADLAAYVGEVAAARESEAAVASLEDVFSRPGREAHDLRWVMLHMIEEYARHNGHADLIREVVDGATGDGFD
jgi:uncharacterized damage-inducible protein DinB